MVYLFLIFSNNVKMCYYFKTRSEGDYWCVFTTSFGTHATLIYILVMVYVWRKSTANMFIYYNNNKKLYRVMLGTLHFFQNISVFFPITILTSKSICPNSCKPCYAHNKSKYKILRDHIGTLFDLFYIDTLSKNGNATVPYINFLIWVL